MPEQEVSPQPVESVPVINRDPIFFLGSVLFVLVALAFGAVVILDSVRAADTKTAQARLDELNKTLKEAKYTPTLASYLAVEGVTTQMTKVRSNRYLFLPTWNLVKASVPKDVQFQSLTMSDDGTFRITGTSKSVSSVAAFSEALSKNTSISVVTPLSVDKQGTGDTYSFSVSFAVAGTGAKNE